MLTIQRKGKKETTDDVGICLHDNLYQMEENEFCLYT